MVAAVQTTSRAAHPVRSAAFWRAYGVTMRPYLCFVSGAAGLVGLALAFAQGSPALAALPLAPAAGAASFAGAFAALFLTYGLGQALTDVFQTDTDTLSSPYRPLTRGAITRAQVLAVSLAGLALCGLVLAVLNPWTLPLSALAVLGLVAYTWFKRRWWGGPLWNAWVVAVLPAIGFLAGGGRVGALGSDRQLQAVMVSVLFSYAVFVLLGYFKDVSADRATGYRTLVVVAGWRTATWVSFGFALAAVAASGWLLEGLHAFDGGGAPSLAVALPLWLAGAGCIVGAHPYMLRIRAESEAHRAITWTVRGFVLLHLGESAVALPALVIPALLFYGLFEVVMARRPERSQV
jgi:geranylgeranylglycerol-phosphate geranylgeranyltransferase